jgi:hypothetical protein
MARQGQGMANARVVRDAQPYANCAIRLGEHEARSVEESTSSRARLRSADR